MKVLGWGGRGGGGLNWVVGIINLLEERDTDFSYSYQIRVAYVHLVE